MFAQNRPIVIEYEDRLKSAGLSNVVFKSVRTLIDEIR